MLATDEAPGFADASESISAGAAADLLRRWRRLATRLSFSYFRSGGGLVQSGRATVLRRSPALLTLDASATRLAFALQGAAFRTGPVDYFDVERQTSVRIEGLSVLFDNGDWLFVSPENTALEHLGSPPR